MRILNLESRHGEATAKTKSHHETEKKLNQKTLNLDTKMVNVEEEIKKWTFFCSNEDKLIFQTFSTFKSINHIEVLVDPVRDEWDKAIIAHSMSRHQGRSLQQAEKQEDYNLLL